MAILKLLSRKQPSYLQLLNYITDSGKIYTITQNIRGNTLLDFEREFLINESYRPKRNTNSIYLYHDILSFSAKENPNYFTNEVLNDIAKTYMDLRGRDTVIVGGIHKDKEHLHFHFAVSPVKYRTGKSIRMSKFEMLELKQRIQEYHTTKYPSISYSVPKHGSQKLYLKDHEIYGIEKNNIGLSRSQTFKIIKECLYMAKSKTEFYDLLLRRDIYSYQRGEKTKGFVIGDKHYRDKNLGADLEMLEKIPEFSKQEQKAFDEIHNLRNRRNEKNYDELGH